MATLRLKGRTREVVISPEDRTYTIGERCNALAYKKVRQSVEAGDFSEVLERARVQVKAGADIVNINMVGTSQPEEVLLPKAVELLSAAVDVPLSIDFGSFAALEAALKIAPGRSLINSVNAEESKLLPVLELASKYRAAFIALGCGEGGIPNSPGGRLKEVEKIVQRAESFRLGLDDMLLDAICLGVGTDAEAGVTTFNTCRLMREKLQANIVLGSSNAAFGMPNRRQINAAYLPLAIQAGMNVALTDPTLPDLKWAILAADCCLARDEFGARLVRQFRQEQQEKAAQEGTAAS